MPNFSYVGDMSLRCKTITISSGTTTSEAVDLKGHGLTGIVMPSAFTGSTMTFQGSVDNASFLDIYNADGTKFSATVAADRFIAFFPGDFVAPRWIKLVSGSSEGADRTICLLLRGYV